VARLWPEDLGWDILGTNKAVEWWLHSFCSSELNEVEGCENRCTDTAQKDYRPTGEDRRSTKSTKGRRW